MRQYDIVSGILLILSTIDFALAAPVLGQEKRQTCVDVVHIPKDVITVLGKRGGGEGFALTETIDKIWKDYYDNLEHSDQEEWPEPHSPILYASSPPPELVHESTNAVTVPVLDPAPSTAHPDPTWGFVPSYKGGYEPNLPHYTPTSSGDGSDREFMEAHALQPNHPLPSIDSDSSTDQDFDQNHLMDLVNSQPPRPAPPIESSQANEYLAEHPPLPVFQPADLLAAIYAAKGKAKESRRIPGTARDIENVT